MDILDFMKIKNLCAKDSVKKVKKTTHRKEENTHHISDEGLISRTIKNSDNSTIGDLKWAKDLNHSSRRYENANKLGKDT